MEKAIKLLKSVDISFKSGMWDPLWNTLTSRYPIGTNVFERDWDLLVVLDSCRADVLSELAPEFEFIDEVESITSVGSYSAEWMLKTFTEEHIDKINRTGYVSGNSWSNRVLKNQIHRYESVEDAMEAFAGNNLTNRPVKPQYRKIYFGWPAWKTVSADELSYYEDVWYYQSEYPTKMRAHPEASHLPDVITDRAISVGREYDPGRLIVHYSLPHSPFIAEALDGRALEPHESTDYDEAVKNGNATRDQIYESYRKNVRLALNHVRTLLNNIDAERAVITADHGEALGEYGLYKHMYGLPHPFMKTVPWAETTAVDSHTYEPEFERVRSIEVEERHVRQSLKDMGYL